MLWNYYFTLAWDSNNKIRLLLELLKQLHDLQSNSCEPSIVFGFVPTTRVLWFINIDQVFLSIHLRWLRFRIQKCIKIMRQKQKKGCQSMMLHSQMRWQLGEMVSTIKALQCRAQEIISGNWLFDNMSWSLCGKPEDHLLASRDLICWHSQCIR